MNAATAYENLLNLDTIVSGLLVLLGAAAGYNVGRTAGRRAPQAGAWRGLVLFGTVVALIVVKIVLVVLSARSWVFVADRVLIILPLVAVPAAVAAVTSVPRLWRLARHPPAVSAVAVRRWAAAPLLVTPVHATAVGAAFGFWFTFIRPVSADLIVHTALAWASWLLLVGLLHLRQTRRRDLFGSARATTLLRPARRLTRGVAVVGVAALLAGGTLLAAVEASRLPSVIPSGHGHGAAPGAAGHGAHAAAAGGPATVGVDELVEPATGEPDRRFTLVAQDTEITLASGRVVDGHTFNGTSPGPELRVRQGDLVEVTLVNETAEDGVTAHWHGVDVPNAADGVPGVTQDAVPPGGTHVYRFRVVEEQGTHWYHTHQDSAGNVSAGLWGPMIVEPAAGPPPPAQEIFVPLTGWPVDGALEPAVGTSDVLDRRAVAPGTPVRLRIVDVDVSARRLVLDGTAFRVTALDGHPVAGPAEIERQLVTIGAGGRVDLEFTMPDGPVRLTHVWDPDGGLLLSPDGTGDVVPDFAVPDFDPTAYGTPGPVPFGPDDRFDREVTQVFDSAAGFYDGAFTFLWMTNGTVFPDLPPITVREGELVRVRFANRSRFDHPMHLHGHKMLVLSRNGVPASGSPLWLDTVDVDVGEEYEVAFRADNPGVWMDHCHNFLHAEAGMMMHLDYEGVSSPYDMGHGTPNNPA